MTHASQPNIDLQHLAMTIGGMNGTAWQMWHLSESCKSFFNPSGIGELLKIFSVLFAMTEMISSFASASVSSEVLQLLFRAAVQTVDSVFDLVAFGGQPLEQHRIFWHWLSKTSTLYHEELLTTSLRIQFAHTLSTRGLFNLKSIRGHDNKLVSKLFLNGSKYVRLVCR